MPAAEKARYFAAAHAAHFERWRVNYASAPIYAPPGREGWLPDSPSSAARTIAESGAGNRLTQSATRALARSKSRVLNKLPTEWSGQPEDGARPEKCHCYEATAVRLGLAKHPDPILDHRAQLHFDAKTQVSKATEHVVFALERDIASQLIWAGMPQNWTLADQQSGDDDFFKATFPARRKAGVWEEIQPLRDDEPGWNEGEGPPPGYRPSQSPWFLREQAQWNWNNQYEGGTDVVLRIDRYEPLLDGKEPTFDPGAKIPNNLVGISFDYSLRECVQTKFFIANTPGGLNIDDGHVSMQWKSARDSVDGKGTLTIDATKSLRYSATDELTSQEIMLLNMMAPSTLSMLVQYLALDGPIEFIQRLEQRKK